MIFPFSPETTIMRHKILQKKKKKFLLFIKKNALLNMFQSYPRATLRHALSAHVAKKKQHQKESVESLYVYYIY